jgi:hypothetical protein
VPGSTRQRQNAQSAPSVLRWTRSRDSIVTKPKSKASRHGQAREAISPSVAAGAVLVVDHLIFEALDLPWRWRKLRARHS